MSKEVMLAELVKFFDKTGLTTEVSTYSATEGAPYTRQLIKKVFGSYELMLEAVKAVKAVKPVKVAAKVAVKDTIKVSKKAGA